MAAAAMDSGRTVVVSGVPDVLSTSRMADKLTIHFQSGKRSHGGDVERVTYPTNMEGVAFITFDRAEADLEAVIIQVQLPNESKLSTLLSCPEDIRNPHLLLLLLSNVMSDFSPDSLTDTPASKFPAGKRSYFLCPQLRYQRRYDGELVRNQLKLFTDAEKVLKKEQQILKDDEFPENLYLLTVFPFSKDVFLYVASATLDLSVFDGDQESLINSLRSAHRSIRFSSLTQQRKATIEGPFSAIKALREDLMQRTRHLQPPAQSATVQPNGSTKTKQTPTSQKSLAEPREVQKPKTQRDSPRQRVLNENHAGRSSSKNNEADLKAQSRRDAHVNYGRTKSRQVVGKEGNARVESSLSRLHPTEEKSGKQPRGDAFLQKQSKSGGMFKEEQSGLRTDYVKDLSNSKLNDSQGNQGLPPGDSEDFLVDLYTFKYIQKFYQKELDGCFKGLSLNKSIKCVEGGDLVQLHLADKQPTKSALKMFQTGLGELQMLVKFWQSHLRVQEIPSLNADRQKLAWLCDEASSQVGKVIYIIEDSCVKIIGPSTRSYLFYQAVKDRMDSR